MRLSRVEAVSRLVPTFGFTPFLRLEGLMDTDVPPDIAEVIPEALEEAPSNAARHAHATAVEITARATGARTAEDGGRQRHRPPGRAGVSGVVVALQFQGYLQVAGRRP